MEDHSDWIKAGKITAQVREESKQWIKPGIKLLDAAEKIEARIRELGAHPAFPVNISLNETAAHDTPQKNDTRIFSNQLVKVDIGVHVNGAMGDTACTVDLSGKYTSLVLAAEEALAAALSVVKTGVTIGEVGLAIETAIKKRGFMPVVNLSGHGLARYTVHTDPSIPNYNTGDKTPLKKGQIIAIEPFATTGVGRIKESGSALIFSPIAKRPLRDPFARTLLSQIEAYGGIPFATRWLISDLAHAAKVQFALRLMEQQQCLEPHPPLVEVSGGMVSQAEHTLIVDDVPIILTK